MPRYTFRKHERLTHTRIFTALFERGETYKAYPLILRVIALPESDKDVVQAAFSASKRRFKRAVDRNRIKRLLRECWRHQKEQVRATAIGEHRCFALVWVYIGQELPVKSELEVKISDLCERFIEDIPNFPAIHQTDQGGHDEETTA